MKVKEELTLDDEERSERREATIEAARGEGEERKTIGLRKIYPHQCLVKLYYMRMYGTPIVFDFGGMSNVPLYYQKGERREKNLQYSHEHE